MTPIPIPCPHCGAVLKVRDPKQIGHRAKCPKCAQVFRLEEPATVGAAALAGNESVPQHSASPAPLPASVSADALPNWPTDAAPVGVAGQLQAQRKKNRRRMIVGSCVSAVVLLLAGLVAVYVYQTLPKELPVDLAVEEDPQEDNDSGPSSPEKVAAESKVEPIELKYIPAGTRIVVHLRPAELWQPDSKGEEFRFCLGPISEFLAAKMQDLVKRDPAQISEAMFCLIPNERGTPPDIAAVFHLKEEAKKSQLLDDFGGRRSESQEGIPYYFSGDRAYLIPDLKTIAVCPATLAEEMVTAINDIQPTSPGIDELMFLTDRSRPVTVVFEPVSTRIDAEFLMPPTAIPLLDQFFEWLGPEVETAVWSLEWQKELFRSEILVRNQGGLDARILERQLQRRLDELAGKILNVVKQFSPQEIGKRKVIGRVPAMAKAFTLATHTEPGPRYVKLVTVLPERAAPNLALGTLLAWDESTRTILQTKPSAGDSEKDKPDNTPLADKLKRKITVEFKKTPLQVALDTIGEEIKAKVVIDGDGLKLAGYTKNMEQNFAMENTPAINVVEKIFKQPMYDKMCLVVDVQKNVLLFTTYAVAEQKGMKPYDFSK